MKNLNLSKLKYFHLKIYMIKATNRTSKNILMNNAREEIKKIKKIVMNRIDK